MAGVLRLGGGVLSRNSAALGAGQYASPYTNLNTVITPLALPTLPVAGGSFADPTFPDVQITRVTDSGDGSIVGTSYGRYRTFNSDCTKMLILRLDNTMYVCSVDLSSGTPVFGTKHAVPNSPNMWQEQLMWHPTDPDIGYAVHFTLPRLYEYDFSNLNSITQTLVADFASASDGVSTILSNDKFDQPSIADDGDHFGATWVSSGGTRKGYAVCRRSTQALIRATVKPAAWGSIDEGSISRDHNHAYLIDGFGINSVYHDLVANTTNEQPDGEPGHHDTFGTDGLVGWDDVQGAIIKTSMSDPATRTTLFQTIVAEQTGNLTLNHTSCRANDSTRCLTEFYPLQSLAHVRLTGEFVRFKMDGSGGERLCHHYSLVYTGGDQYTPTPRANSVRVHGYEWIAGTSNMRQGLDSRCDMYLWRCPL